MIDAPGATPPSSPTAPASGVPAQAPSAPAGKSKLRSWIIRIVRIPILAYLGLCAYMFCFENSFIFYPSKHPEGSWEPKMLDPLTEDCWIPVAEGVRIHAWWAPGKAPARGTILFSHGNAGNITDRILHFRPLLDRHFNVLAYDYEGYGRSDGAPSETTCTRDVLAAHDYLTRERKVPPAEIISYGESIGCAQALLAALERPCGAVILEAPFTSLPEVGQFHFPFLPVRWIARSKFDNLGRIPSLKVPVLIVHGRRDEIVPFAQGERLFAAAPEPKEFVAIEEGTHNDLVFTGGGRLFDKIRSWVDPFLNRK
ncbi:MAG: alpha/beta fold hydrolase [Planctomycetes bacterium]|nr:alpha/beta fold hydrolase [Planctomycetota bacterium]